MAGKTGKQFLFEVQLDWLAGTRGILSADDAEGSLLVATPPEYGGEGKPWAAEHFFLGAISSSFMTTYFAYSKKLGLQIARFECAAIGQVEIINGRYRFTTINLYPKIYISDDYFRKNATLALTKSIRNCLVVNSVKATVWYHSEILVVQDKSIVFK